MISEKMSKLLERSAAMSSMYTESARLKEKYGAENVKVVEKSIEKQVYGV